MSESLIHVFPYSILYPIEHDGNSHRLGDAPATGAGLLAQSLVRTIRLLTQIAARRSRSEFAITETELKLIAAAAIIGLNRIPKNG